MSQQPSTIDPFAAAEARGPATPLAAGLHVTRAAVADLAFDLGSGQAVLTGGQTRELAAAAVQLETSLAGLRAILRELT
jgi:hypothetical protein